MNARAYASTLSPLTRYDGWQDKREHAGTVALQLGCDICTYIAEDMWSAVCRREDPDAKDVASVVDAWVTGSCDRASPGRTTLLGVFDIRKW